MSFIKLKNQIINFSIFEKILLGLNIFCYVLLPFIFHDLQKEWLSLQSGGYLSAALDTENINKFLPVVLLAILGLTFGIIIEKKTTNRKINFKLIKARPSNLPFLFSLPFLLLFLYPSGSFILNLLRDIPVLYGAYNLYLDRKIGQNKLILILSYFSIGCIFASSIRRIAFNPIFTGIIYVYLAKNISKRIKFSKKFKIKFSFKFFVKTILLIIVFSLIAIFLSIKGTLRGELDFMFRVSSPLEWLPYINIENIKNGWVGQLLIRINSSIPLSVVMQQDFNPSPYITHGLTAFIPRIIFPNKPLNDLANQFGRDFSFIGIDDFTTSVNIPFIVQSYMIFGSFLIFIPMIIQGYLFSYHIRALNLAKIKSEIISPKDFISSALFFANTIFTIENSYSSFAAAIFSYYSIKIIFNFNQYIFNKKLLLNE